MPKIEGVEKVQAQLRRLAREKGQQDASVVVGYTANYALYVHEDLTAFHRVGQAKYLEQPARELAGELGRMVRVALKQGASVGRALLLAGLRLQRESQLLVPVDTGNLKNSAFTRLETE